MHSFVVYVVYVLFVYKQLGSTMKKIFTVVIKSLHTSVKIALT